MSVRHGFRYTSGITLGCPELIIIKEKKKGRKTKWKENLQLDDGSSVLMMCQYVLLCKVFVCLLVLFLLGDHMIAKAYLQNSYPEFYCQMSARQQTHGKKEKKKIERAHGMKTPTPRSAIWTRTLMRDAVSRDQIGAYISCIVMSRLDQVPRKGKPSTFLNGHVPRGCRINLLKRILSISIKEDPIPDPNCAASKLISGRNVKKINFFRG